MQVDPHIVVWFDLQMLFEQIEASVSFDVFYKVMEARNLQIQQQVNSPRDIFVCTVFVTPKYGVRSVFSTPECFARSVSFTMTPARSAVRIQ